MCRLQAFEPISCTHVSRVSHGVVLQLTDDLWCTKIPRGGGVKELLRKSLEQPWRLLSFSDHLGVLLHTPRSSMYLPWCRAVAVSQSG